MKRSFVWLIRLCIALFLISCAHSVYASTFDFTFSGSGFSGSGTLTATLVSGDQFMVTGISGMQNGMAMTLLDPNTYGGNDNDIFSSSPFLDLSGLAFSVGALDYNIYYDAAVSSYLECTSSSTDCQVAGEGSPVTFGLTATPEPGSLLLLGTGLLGLGPFVRRRSARILG